MAARKTTILIVDDDEALRHELAQQLEMADEYTVIQAGRIADGIAKALDAKPGVILLDVELPDGDGRDACRDLRAKGVTAPILMLTGQLTEADQVRGLDSGANDYVTKPFKIAVLLARIRAHLRSHESSEDAVFHIGPYEFRPSAKLLAEPAGGRKVRLTDKETSILRYLYRAGQKSVSREELLREVWGYNAAVTTHTLETHIYRLRQKIEPDPAVAAILLTETGGYRLKV
jgi:DNA-binding response OmpR family regulator